MWDGKRPGDTQAVGARFFEGKRTGLNSKSREIETVLLMGFTI
jgi:hypothetical protein